MFRYIKYTLYTVCVSMLMDQPLSAQTCEEVIGEKSGLFIETGGCKNGLREGEWFFLYDRQGAPESRARAKGNYKNGKKDGVWYFYRATNGPCQTLRIEEVVTYVNDIKEGQAFTFYPDVCDMDKAVKLSGLYKNDKREGLWAHYSKEGKDEEHIIKGVNFVNDKIAGEQYDFTHGRQITYEYAQSDGETELPSIYSDGQILARNFDGYVEYYYRVTQGTQPIKQRKHYDEAGLPTGLWTDYYPNGKVKEHHTPEEMVAYRPNGRLQKREYYLAGWRKTREPDGGMIKILYDKNGELKSMTLSFESGRTWTIGFHPNRAVEAVYIKEPKMSWNHYDDGSIRSEYTYTSSGKMKSKFFDQGKKQPTSPPAWQTKALENPDPYTREKLKAFFEMIETTRKEKN